MTYDEIKLAALLQVSSPVMPINSGSRHNVGRLEHGVPHVEEAVYVGAVGARFEKAGVMEWQEMVIDPEQNVEGEKLVFKEVRTINVCFNNFYFREWLWQQNCIRRNFARGICKVLQSGLFSNFQRPFF
jgi:hypothetical protein